MRSAVESSRLLKQRAGAGAGMGGSGPPHDERFEQLEQLGRPHDAGTLDDDEFRAEKQRILSATVP